MLHEKTTCRLCNSSSLELILDMGTSPIGEDFLPEEKKNEKQEFFPVKLMRCIKCGQVQLSHTVSSTKIYEDNYLYLTTRSLGLDKHFEAYADSVLQLPNVSTKDFIVDIGSNAGTLLASFQRHGNTILGIEPSKLSAQFAQKQGIDTLCTFFNEKTAKQICSQKGQAKIITINNCLANIDNLTPIIEGIDTLLSPDGWFIIETGYLIDLIQNFVIDNIYHEHLSYFNLQALNGWLEKYGFAVAKAERVHTKGGSLRIYARRKNIVPQMPWNVLSLIRLENELGFQTEAPFVAFQKKATQKKQEIQKAVQEFTAQGKCAAFGASVGGTALLYWLEIGHLFSCIIDDNTDMHGKYSPGHHLPVLNPTVLKEQNINLVVNLAWRYILPILKNHNDFLKNGGKMMNILPQITIF